MLLTLFLTFGKVGLFTLGSGYAMLALLQREVIDNHRWLSGQEFADMVALAEVTPGPIMVNMATFIGFKLEGLPGSVAATLGLILPPVVVVIAISHFYLDFKDHVLARALFRGLRPAVVALILVAVLNLGRTSIVDVKSAVVFVAVLLAVAVARLNPIYAVLGGMVAGLVFLR